MLEKLNVGQISDSAEKFGLVSRLFHWITFILIFWELFFSHGIHKQLGLLIITLTFLRIIWLAFNYKHRPAYANDLIGKIEKITHVLIYGLLIIIPAIGISLIYAKGKELQPLFNATGVETEWLFNIGHVVHEPLAWILCVIVLGHAAIALFHKYIIKDNRYEKMWG